MFVLTAVLIVSVLSPLKETVQVTWSWDPTLEAGGCAHANLNSTLNISGVPKVERVSSCTDSSHCVEALECLLQQNHGGPITLMARWNNLGNGTGGSIPTCAYPAAHSDGPVVSTGCSTVMQNKRPAPKAGVCCFSTMLET
jgi:hypothetical protein